MPKYMPKVTTIEMDATKGKAGSVGLSYPVLSRNNYTAWSMKMKVYMQAQGVWDAVEPSDPKVAVEDRTDKVALAAIYQRIPEDLLLALAEKKTAKEAWDSIKIMCEGAERVQKAKVQTLKAEFESLTMKDTDQLDDFFMKLVGIVTNIRSLGEKMEESYVVKKLLRAVPSKFLQIASTIEQFGNLEEMTVEETIGRLKAHEERVRGTGSDTNSGQLLLTQEEWQKRNSGRNSERGRGRGSFRGRGAHQHRGGVGGRGNQGKTDDNSRSKTAGRDRSKLKCFNYNAYGHFAAECRRPKREKDHKDQKQEVNLTQIKDDESALLLTERSEPERKLVLLNERSVFPRLTTSGDSKMQSSIWYLDNGASNHMTGDRTKFKTLDESVAGEVKFGDGSSVVIKGKGTIAFKCKNGEEKLFQEVYYIPDLCSNIVTLGQMSEEGNRVVLDGEYLWAYDENGVLLMKVKRSSNRLYKIALEESQQMCLLTKTEEISWTWHARLGHVNFQAMSLMQEKDMVTGIPKLVQPKQVCSGCLMAKQTRKPFPSQSSFTAKSVLELVHGDICGPFSPPTPAGNRYFLLFVDDFSRAIWVYMLKSKDEAFDVFKKFQALVENGSGEKKIKILRTDRGGEFCSSNFTTYCEEAGILRHYTAPYSPQQNGIVERRNRTVVSMARSFLKEKQMPLYFWGEAVRHAVYVLDRLPTRALSGCTPYEAWSGKKPDLGHLKTFRCLAHMKVPSVHTTKLDDRSRVVVYLGKEPGTKAHRLYDPQSKRICVSRDVVFEESKSWTWKTQTGDSTDASPGFFVVSGEDVTREQIDGSTEGEITPVRTTRTQGSDHSTYDDSTEPRRFRLLSEVYDETEEVETSDELLFLGVDEPATYAHAVQNKQWQEAMNSEIEAIERNKTWQLTELPKGAKPIGLKWVYKLKRNTDGDIIKYKARLVAKGYVQRQGIDFEDAFAPVTRMETVRLLLALAEKNGWEVHHLDVKSAFLNGELMEDVYVMQPEGFAERGKEHLVYKLLKALYGLRQAPRAWYAYAKLNQCLLKLGFVKCPYEHAVYSRREGNDALIIGLYVDDLLITGTNVSAIERLKVQVKNEFDMSDLGRLSHYLGIEVNQTKEYIELKQSSYAKKLLEKSGMAECKSTKYPMEPGIQLSKDSAGKEVDPRQFRSTIGGVRYLVHTRPDIAFSVGMVSRFMERPTIMHQNAMKRILRYVKGTINYGLVYAQGGREYANGFF